MQDNDTTIPPAETTDYNVNIDNEVEHHDEEMQEDLGSPPKTADYVASCYCVCFDDDDDVDDDTDDVDDDARPRSASATPIWGPKANAWRARFPFT